MSRIIDVPTGDAANALETVHNVAVDAKRVARFRNCSIVGLQQQYSNTVRHSDVYDIHYTVSVCLRKRTNFAML